MKTIFAQKDGSLLS